MQNQIQPLVSVGIPTFNRPAELKRSLDLIRNQTYENLEIIISDNGTHGDVVDILMQEYLNIDKRIKYYKQSENKGAAFNFKFVLEKASGDYFIWAADDDEWLSLNLISILLDHAPNFVLTFPNAEIQDLNGVTTNFHVVYENCLSQIDYIKTFCSFDHGYPIYGMYNLKKFFETGLKFEFDTDMAYHSDGIFLHKLFLTGTTKYVGDVKILFNANGSLPTSLEKQIDSWNKYILRTLSIYKKSNLNSKDKTEILKTYNERGIIHYKFLLNQFTSNNMFLYKKQTFLNKFIIFGKQLFCKSKLSNT